MRGTRQYRHALVLPNGGSAMSLIGYILDLKHLQETWRSRMLRLSPGCPDPAIGFAAVSRTDFRRIWHDRRWPSGSNARSPNRMRYRRSARPASYSIISPVSEQGEPRAEHPKSTYRNGV